MELKNIVGVTGVGDFRWNELFPIEEAQIFG